MSRAGSAVAIRSLSLSLTARCCRCGLVDLPGYGFAKVSRDMQDDWRKYIEAYLTKRTQLKLATDRDAAKSRHPWRVVLCCDLNITPVMREYEDVVVALGTICKGGVHDVSAGMWEPTFGLSDERLLTQAADRGTQKTNDYIFVGPGAEHMPTRVCTEALEAKKEEHARYQQVSDHKAVVAHWD